MSAFRLFRPSPSKDTMGRSTSSGNRSGLEPLNLSLAQKKSDGDGATALPIIEFTSSPTSMQGPEHPRSISDSNSGVPEISVTCSPPMSPLQSLNGDAPISKRLGGNPELRSFSQQRASGGKGSSNHMQGASEGGLVSLSLATSSKRASRQGMSEADIYSSHSGSMTAVDFGSHERERGLGRGPKPGPLTAGVDRHERMRRAQFAGSAFGDSDDDDEHDSEDDMDDEEDDEADKAEEDGEDGAECPTKNQTRIRSMPPMRGRSNSDTDLQFNAEAHHHGHLPPMPHAHGLTVPASSNAAPKEEGDTPSTAVFDAVPGEGSLTLDHILGAAGIGGGDIVGVDGSVRPAGFGGGTGSSSIGHGGESLSPSRRSSRTAISSWRGHGLHPNVTGNIASTSGSASVVDFGERRNSSPGHYGAGGSKNGMAPTASLANETMNGSSSDGSTAGTSIVGARSGTGGVPPALALSASASKPAEALLSPAQVGASSGGSGGLASRIRKLSNTNTDAGSGTATPTTPNAHGSSGGGASTKPSKKNTGPGGGIAGALAASGLAAANYGVAGLSAVAAQPSPALLPPTARANSGFFGASTVVSGKSSLLPTSPGQLSRTHSPAAVAALTPGAGAHAENGFQGGIYRNPDTGEMVEVGEGQQGSKGCVFDSMSRDSSGLAAAAHFQLGNVPLLSPILPDVNASTARAEPSQFAGSLGMDMAAAMVDDPEMALRPEGLTPDSSGVDEAMALEEQGQQKQEHVQGQMHAPTPWNESLGLETQITGFAVASSKRNADFHAIFGSVGEDDYLIEDYGCALQREILIQGRLYISENHLCFNSNIFGWVTNVLVPFSEIVAIEKRMTAFVIPNAIQVATLHTKHTFSSFLSRDATYGLIVNIWKLSHPSLPQNHTLEYLDLSEDEPAEEGDDDGSKARLSKRAKLRRRFMNTRTTSPAPHGQESAKELKAEGSKVEDAPNASASTSGGSAASVKKAAHKPTNCPCDMNKAHYSTVALDATYPAKPEKMYNLLFTSGFMKGFWTGNQKLTELQMSDWSPSAEHDGLLSRTLSYIKPLAGGFGPKQTKCMISDENLHVDFDDYVTTLTTTRTPDVPSGSSFAVKTRTCFTWAGGNTTKIYVTCTVEWSGRSMLRSIIDKASIDGQKQYYSELDIAIRQTMKDHPSEFKEEGEDETAINNIAVTAADPTEAQISSAGGGSEKKDLTNTTAASPATGSMLGMAQDVRTGAVEFILEFFKDASPSTLILGVIVIVLLISNIWTFASSSSRGRDPQHLHRLRSERYAASPSRSVEQESDAIGQAIRTALSDLIQPKAVDQQGGTTPAEELKYIVSMLDQVESRLGRLRREVTAETSTMKSEL